MIFSIQKLDDLGYPTGTLNSKSWLRQSDKTNTLTFPVYTKYSWNFHEANLADMFIHRYNPQIHEVQVLYADRS